MAKDVNQLRMKLKTNFPESPRNKYRIQNAHASELAKRKVKLLHPKTQEKEEPKPEPKKTTKTKTAKEVLLEE